MIYLLEDDDSIRNFVSYALNAAGFEARGFDTPSAFREAVAEELPELVLLDIMLPEEDGLSILRSLREKEETRDLPVIMLTAKGTEYDRVIGLDSGADDYVTKPFGTMELISRVKALLRRTSNSVSAAPDATEEYRIGELYVCPSKHIIRNGDEDVPLTLKEYELLCMLLRGRGSVFTRDQILSRIWGYEFDGESRTVDVHVRTLRQKLGDSGDVVETVRGIGYKIGGKE